MGASKVKQEDLMLIPVQFAFYGIDELEAWQDWIEERVARLGHFFDSIKDCRFLVEFRQMSRFNLMLKRRHFISVLIFRCGTMGLCLQRRRGT